jgi:hypothetical protein
MNNRKSTAIPGIIGLIVIWLAGASFLLAQPSHQKSQNAVTASWIRHHVTKNPVSPSWIKSHLRKNEPRLLLTPKVEKQLKQKIKTNKLVRTYYAWLHHFADEIVKKPVLKEKIIGYRLPASGKAERRISILALVYRISHNKKYLNRLIEAMNTINNFSNWDSIQFLNVAGMSYAQAIGLDWAGKWLPDSTIKNARSAIKKHLLSSLQENHRNWWVNASNNWNEVCHAGLSAGALVLAGQYPKLAAKIIGRADHNLPIELAQYSPDGAYPEGPGYWGYGTSYFLMAIAFYKSALATDFNLSKAPGFMKSATYRLEVVGPSGKSFAYSDADPDDGLNLSIRGSLAWFAQKTGNSLYLNKKKFRTLMQKAMKQHKKPPSFAPLQLVWLSEFTPKESQPLPTYWKGEGYNPIAIFRSGKNEHSGFYLGVKGGSASVNHGNMDAGSFVFELNGVRWSIDPGNQSYHQVELHIGHALWDMDQNSPRWSLLTKGNRFHSTLTVNGARHNVHGFAPIIKWQVNKFPETVALNLSSTFKGQLKSEIRTFRKINGNMLQIEDDFVPGDSTEKVMWAMMTKAQVTTTKDGAILSQDGRKLRFKIIQPAGLNVSVVSLDPPPLAYDKRIDNLKRIEIIIPYYMLNKKHEKIIVQLKG